MASRLRDFAPYLYEVYCEVAQGDPGGEPFIITKYPHSYKDDKMKDIPKFTFPCPIEKSYVQHYSFVMTSIDSKYTFCFCRYDPKTNSSMVIMSHLPWHDTFYKLLNCVSSVRGEAGETEMYAFLEACRVVAPRAGESLRVSGAGGRSFSCVCPLRRLPRIPDDCNLTEYFSALDANCMVALWAALLCERRVALVATKPARLSACVQAANATLFPMCWQHIFIPLMPRHLADYLLAPMPFLIGVPRHVLPWVPDVAETTVILDVDANQLRSPYDDVASLPTELVSRLKKALSDKQALGESVSRAFLRALVCLIGGYRDAIRIDKNHQITFYEDAFLKTRKNMQPILKKILETQIFQQFKEERLDLLNSGKGFNDEFEVECNLYAEELAVGGGALRRHYRDIARNVKKEGGAFLKSVKDKAHPAVQSAVKSVRQGGKNMKSAVKGLKNKMPRTGSRASSLNTPDDTRCSHGSSSPVSCVSSGSGSESASGSGSGWEAGGEQATEYDLLAEMEFLLTRPRDDNLTAPDDAPPAPAPPPRVPQRPPTPLRYPIVSTRTLIDIADSPPPPPPRAPPAPHYTSTVTRSAPPRPPHRTSALCFAPGSDKPRLRLAVSTQRPPAPPSTTAPLAAPAPPPHPAQRCEDLIQLDVSPSTLDDFDPLKRDEQSAPAPADSALLNEYGLDFSHFSLTEPQHTRTTPESWTTFN